MLAWFPGGPSLAVLELGGLDLAEQGLRWIVVHLDQYPAPQAAKISGFLDTTTRLHFADDSPRIYDVGGRRRRGASRRRGPVVPGGAGGAPTGVVTWSRQAGRASRPRDR